MFICYFDEKAFIRKRKLSNFFPFLAIARLLILFELYTLIDPAMAKKGKKWNETHELNNKLQISQQMNNKNIMRRAHIGGNPLSTKRN